MEIKTNFIEEIFHHIKLDSNGHSIDEISSGSSTEKDFINLCGGIPSNQITYLTLDIQCDKSGVFEVFIFTDFYYVSRTLDFNQKITFNSSLRVNEDQQKQGLGRNLLINQIISARSFKFNLLNANAAGNTMNGFYTWGRLGYTMAFSYREKFNELLRKNNMEERSLFELLKTKEGQKFWMKNGFTWNGIFFLGKGSENIRLLKDYLNEKGMSIPSL
ncbi:MAG: hypothetical protein JWQ09_2552 [Segetibacter sp.]|nr:hypothetical protein [Segetibacter sp.]